jgi:uncharacterized protein (DUF488 family)
MSVIYTIGHSTRSFETFISLLQENNIKCLADVRSFPGSRRYPHFARASLAISLPEHGIEYLWFEKLGGRKVDKARSTENAGWRNIGFHSYADRINDPIFLENLIMLEEVARSLPTSFMCSEAVWWRCHRQVLSDMLLHRGWNVQHIMAAENTQPHSLPKHARVTDGHLHYPLEEK